MSFGVVRNWSLGLRVVAAMVTVAPTILVPMGLQAQAVTGTISGRVLTADGRPLPGATVTAQLEGEDSGLNATADAQGGSFSLTGLPVGGYELWFEAGCYLPERRDIALAAGADAEGMGVRPAPERRACSARARDSSGRGDPRCWGEHRRGLCSGRREQRQDGHSRPLSASWHRSWRAPAHDESGRSLDPPRPLRDPIGHATPRSHFPPAP